MDGVDLSNLFYTGEFSDCTFISSDGEQFPVHRFLFTQYAHLKELVAQGGRVELPESTEVVERMLRWIYDIAWIPVNIQPTRVSIGKEMLDIVGLVDAAKKYEIPQLADDAYGTIDKILREFTNVECALRVLRDLTDKESARGVLQRTVIDRVIVSLPKDIKREEGHDIEIASVTAHDDTDGHTVSMRPKKSGRVRKSTEKAKEPPPKARTKSILQPDPITGPKLHCVCKKPEDAYMVQCDHCNRWFHPGCIGKGTYSKKSYKRGRHFAMKGDEMKYRDRNVRFSCVECDEFA